MVGQARSGPNGRQNNVASVGSDLLVLVWLAPVYVYGLGVYHGLRLGANRGFESGYLRGQSDAADSVRKNAKDINNMFLLGERELLRDGK
jgi:hypothetical protein